MLPEKRIFFRTSLIPGHGGLAAFLAVQRRSASLIPSIQGLEKGVTGELGLGDDASLRLHDSVPRLLSECPQHVLGVLPVPPDAGATKDWVAGLDFKCVLSLVDIVVSVRVWLFMSLVK